MRNATFPVLVVSLLLAGCLEPQDTSRSIPVQKWGAGVGAVNMTGCAGGIAAGSVPHAPAQERVPSAYQVRETEPGLGLVRVDVYTCAKVAVDGMDIGPGSLVYASIRLDEGEPAMPSDDYASWWLFDVWTDLAETSVWLKNRSVAVELAAVSTSFLVSPTPVGQLEAEVTSDGNQVYKLDGTPYSASQAADRKYRLFFDDDPAHDFVVVAGITSQSTGEGPGQITFDSQTGLAEILGAAGASPGTFSWVHDGNRLLRSAA